MVTDNTCNKKSVYFGIFWVLAESEEDIRLENLICIKQKHDDVFPEYADYSAKNSAAYNHERSWQMFPKKITHRRPYNYYPRGRVEVSDGKATVWMNGSILGLAEDVIDVFGLSVLNNVKVKEDGTSHYKCHFDKGFIPAKR